MKPLQLSSAALLNPYLPVADNREIYAVDLVRSTLNTASPFNPSLLREDPTVSKPPPPPEKPPPNPEDTDPFLKYGVVRPPPLLPPAPSSVTPASPLRNREIHGHEKLSD